jgi:hypothetical protein
VQDNGICIILDPATRFYNDLPAAEQDHWVSLLKPCSAKTQLQAVTYVAFLYHPVTHLICENDQALPAFLQRKMISNVEGGKAGLGFTIERCTAGHSPFSSQPDVLVKVAKKMVN